MRSSLLLLSCALACTTPSFAQDSTTEGFSCSANDPVQLARHLAAHPRSLEHAQAANARLEAYTSTFDRAQRGGEEGPYIIPVVFHIIHNNGFENISDGQVYDAVRVLNLDYNRENPDWENVRPEFLHLVADVGITFRLATLDPDGNCTNGITRTVSPLTYNGDFEMTQLIQWPRERYLNIWVGASANGAAGYTYYPMWLDDWPEADGIVVMHTYVGSIGTSSPYTSRVLTHEVGHWLNLAHCWGSTNEPGEAANCTTDDGVADTPNTIGWTTCVLSGTSCGSPLNNVENYMEYSYCCKMFTHGQGDRMLAALTSNVAQRQNLWQTDNLAQTGVSTGPVLCQAAFTHGPATVCTGSTVEFTDVSYHGVIQRTWTFPGGTPNTSDALAPVVQYDVAGVYPVTLEVSDGVNELTSTTQQLVVVYDDPGHAVPFTESFETTNTLPDTEWQVLDNDGGNGFMLTDEAAYTGTKSVFLLNEASLEGQKDHLYSPAYDLSEATDIRVTFRYAFAQRNTSNDDRLRFYVSNNCGRTWSMRKQLRAGTDLATVGITSGSFFPTDTTEWGLAVVDNISSNFLASNFRMRFEFESDGGNNVFIDDVNVNGISVGIAHMDHLSTGVQVLPNPATDAAELVFTLASAGLVHIGLSDMVGRAVSTGTTGTFGAGAHRIVLPIERLPSGIYTVRLQQGDRSFSTRFVVDHD